MASASQFEQLNRRYSQLSQREKIMVLVLGVAFVAYVGFELVLAETIDNKTRLERSLATKETQILALDSETQAANLQLTQDPDVPLKERIERLNNRIAQLDQDFEGKINELIPATDMPKVLKSMFDNAEGIEIVSLQSNAAVDLFSSEPQQYGVSLYQHGMDVEFSGEFFAIMTFLESIEKMNYQMYWHSLTYNVEDYPSAKVKLTVFTLSTEQEFIGV